MTEVSAHTRALINPDEAEHFYEAFRSHRLRMGDARVPVSMLTLELYCRGLMSGHDLDRSAPAEDAGDVVIAITQAADLAARDERTLRRWVAGGFLSYVEVDGVRGFRPADVLAAREAMGR